MHKLIPLLFILLLFQFSTHAQQTVGLQQHDSGSVDDGYILFPPLGYTSTYLIDKCGKKIHEWTNTATPGASSYLLPDGLLLRPALAATNNLFKFTGGAGGLIQKLDWNSKVTWSYRICDSFQCQHHDVEPLPNGNILVMAWARIPASAALAMGRKQSEIPSTKFLWGEKIVELKPQDSAGATIVWQWNVWDHLVQDNDSTISNFGKVADHPELIDINYVDNLANISPDWLHNNSIKYNPDLDQIILSPHNFSEIWVIDHSTTTAEASSHKGGTHGRGGDILYRWGNPVTYRKGTAYDQKLYLSHDPVWIPKGMPNAGKIMIFNNGNGRPGNYSSVDIISPPVDASGNYDTSYLPYYPTGTDWSYTAPVPADFYSANIGGAQMLPNGNVLICNGASGDFFEVTADKNKVWEYYSPINNKGPVKQGTMHGFQVFRCTYYPADYAGFSGRTLTAGNPIETSPIAYDCHLHTSGISQQTFQNNFKIANPVSDNIIIRYTGSDRTANFELYDGSGRKVYCRENQNLRAGEIVTLSPGINLKPGIYLLNITGTDVHYSAKLLMQKD